MNPQADTLTYSFLKRKCMNYVFRKDKIRMLISTILLQDKTMNKEVL